MPRDLRPKNPTVRGYGAHGCANALELHYGRRKHSSHKLLSLDIQLSSEANTFLSFISLSQLPLFTTQFL